MVGFLKRIFIWWHGYTVGTGLFTWWKGEFIATDEAGNRYYREKGGNRRWVLYDGPVEGSRVPPEWDAWLHYTAEEPPTVAPAAVKDWEQPHQPNLTGTPRAYRPAGSLAGAGQRRRATGDYEAWSPDD